MILKKHTGLPQNMCLSQWRGNKVIQTFTGIRELIFKGLRKVIPKSNNGVILSECVSKDKSKSIKSIMRYVLSENILVEKYQVIIVVPWNSKRTADALNRFVYSAGCICKSQHHPQWNQAALPLVWKRMHSSTGRKKGWLSKQIDCSVLPLKATSWG